MSTDVSIVMVNYNTRDQTVDAVKSVLRERGDVSAQIIVVDNGSEDGSVEGLEDLRSTLPDPSVIDIVDAGENLGFARAVNVGVERARGDYVLLLNPDTTMLEGSLPALVRFARANPQYGVFGGRTVRPDGGVEPSSCWGAPSLWSLTAFALLLSTLFRQSRLFDPESLGTWPRDTIREVPIITGCLLLMALNDFRAIGGMDEDFFLYGEDAELSMRARAHGMTCIVYPPATIVHTVGGSSTSTTKGAMVMAGKVTYLNKTWSPRRAAVGRALLHTGVAARAALEMATLRGHRPWGAVWRGRRDWAPGYPAARAAIFGDSSRADDVSVAPA
ncbi:glycosyltransferase family 2 protein [Microbacterium sp. bgisy203]|uniref:glycosyltransferase family 2 protein n=1 Tax=Microbacterium sp. bgisy203 TaxID=3413799 RepID=UPI003D74E563